MSSHRRGRRRKRASAQWRAFTIAAVVIVIPLIGWSVSALMSGDDAPSVSPTATASLARAPTVDDPRDVDSDEAAADAVEACATRLDAGTDAIDEATTGIEHWAGHIGARADWLAGRLSDEQKAARYAETKLAGPDDQRRFHAASAEYESLEDCSELDDLVDADDTDGNADVIGACLDRQERTAAVITAGTAAMADWGAHLDAMAAHASGDMPADEANETWVQAATTAPTNINAFEDARDQWERAPECSAAG